METTSRCNYGKQVNRFWTADEDAILLDGVADGVMYKVIGAQLGRTKNSCIGRMYRIARKTLEERGEC